MKAIPTPTELVMDFDSLQRSLLDLDALVDSLAAKIPAELSAEAVQGIVEVSDHLSAEVAAIQGEVYELSGGLDDLLLQYEADAEGVDAARVAVPLLVDLIEAMAGPSWRYDTSLLGAWHMTRLRKVLPLVEEQ